MSQFTLTCESGSCQATLIHIFERDEDAESTPAPTFHNMALVAFSVTPAISRVALFLTDRSIPLFLVDVARRWFDVTVKPVKVAKR